jgi:hypothetical protein
VHLRGRKTTVDAFVTRESATFPHGLVRPFWKPIKLKDGRMLRTLGDAFELFATLPALKQAEGHWRDADEMLVRAAVAPSAIDDALAAMVRALKVERLI